MSTSMNLCPQCGLSESLHDDTACHFRHDLTGWHPITNDEYATWINRDEELTEMHTHTHAYDQADDDGEREQIGNIHYICLNVFVHEVRSSLAETRKTFLKEFHSLLRPELGITLEGLEHYFGLDD